MLGDTRRITVIARNTESSPRPWNLALDATSRVILVNSLSMLLGTLQVASQDIERLILDGTGTPTHFLELLTSLPATFLGDVVFRTIGGSFLSAASRVEGRVLYTMTPADLQFYLETNDLVVRTLEAA